MSPEQKALIDRAIKEPWLVSRNQLEAVLDVVQDEVSQNSVWEARYIAEDVAVHEGRWPSNVPIPDGVDTKWLQG
jgi:hypothetical protein